MRRRVKGRPRRAKRRRGTKARHKARRSRFVNRKGMQIAIFHPHRRNCPLPDQFWTTLSLEMRLHVAAAVTPGLSGLAQQFNIQAFQLTQPFAAHNANSFVAYGASAPAVTAIGDFTNTTNPVAYTSLASIYEYYAVVDSTISVGVDGINTAGDIVYLQLIPVQVLQNSIVTGLNPYTNSSIIAKNKYVKEARWAAYVNETDKKIVNHINAVEYFGYPGLREYLADTDNHMVSANANTRPTQDTLWQLAYMSGQSGNTAGTFDMTIRLDYRVVWHSIGNPIPTA